MITLSDNEQSFKEEDFIYKSELLLKSLSKKEVEAIHNAIEPETKVDVSPRGKAEIIIINESTLQMIFQAVDFVSLRAILGSYLRWLDGALKSLNVMEKD